MNCKDELFLNKIKRRCIVEDDCWVWAGRLNDGKPFITVSWEGKREHFAVRRFLYLLDHKDVELNSSDTFYTTCGNPACVNPAHLALGVGAGTMKGHKIASVLKKYKELVESGGKWSIDRASKELNVSWATLKKYLELYNADPERWERLWNSTQP